MYIYIYIYTYARVYTHMYYLASYECERLQRGSGR